MRYGKAGKLYKLLRCRKGETLVESVLSILLLGLLLAAVAAMLTTAVNLTESAISRSEEHLLAANRAVDGTALTNGRRVSISFSDPATGIESATAGKLSDEDGYIVFGGGTP